MSSPTVLLDQQGPIRYLTLNRPDRLNSLNRDMLARLGELLGEAAADSDCRLLVLRGAGRAFCAGQDLRDSAAIRDDAAIRDTIERLYNPVIRQIRALRMPVLAAVNGVAAGAGASLALACDITIAAESAQFIQSFATIGLTPDAGASYFLPRRVGNARALGLAMLGTPLDARTAMDWGLIWQAVADADFDRAVADMADNLAARPTRALALIKESFSRSAHQSLEQQLLSEASLQAEAARTEDFEEGISAFLEKRAPFFNGR